MRERRAIYDGWHTDGDDWHAERLFVQRGARVAHARSRRDAGVRKLNRAQQA